MSQLTEQRLNSIHALFTKNRAESLESGMFLKRGKSSEEGDNGRISLVRMESPEYREYVVFKSEVTLLDCKERKEGACRIL